MILELLITLIILGLILYVVSLLPIDATIKQIIRAVAIVFILIWILQLLFGFVPGAHTHNVWKIH